MLKIQLLLAFCLNIWASSTPKDFKSGKLPILGNGENVRKIDLHISSGKLNVSHRDYPFTAGLLISNEDGTQIFGCTGSIVSTTLVITSCHCVCTIFVNETDHTLVFTILSPENSKVIAGASDVYDENAEFRQEIGVRELHPHPKCNLHSIRESHVTMYNDTAVVQLSVELEYNDEIQPIKLYSADEGILMRQYRRLAAAGADCITIGWQTIKDGTASTKLTGFSSAHSVLIDSKFCKDLLCGHLYWKDFENILDCSIDPDEGYQACVMSGNNGATSINDSGAVLVCDGYLYGIHGLNLEVSTDIPVQYGNAASILHLLKLHTQDESYADVNTEPPTTTTTTITVKTTLSTTERSEPSTKDEIEVEAQTQRTTTVLDYDDDYKSSGRNHRIMRIILWTVEVVHFVQMVHC